MKISEALATYLLQLEADGRSTHTRRQYQRHVALLVRVLGDVDVCAITTADVARALVSQVITHDAEGQPKKATTVNAIRTTVRVFFGWLHDAGVIASNPARLVRRARCGAPPPRALSGDDQRRLLDTLARARGWESQRDHLLFHVMLATGIRLASALSLDIADVHLERAELRLRRTKGDVPWTTFLGVPIRDHLARYVGGRGVGVLFPSRHGTQMSARQAQRRLSMWLARAGITREASPHSLRHAFGMRIYSETRDVLLVQRAMGHRAIASTMTYVRCSDERLRGALA